MRKLSRIFVSIVALCLWAVLPATVYAAEITVDSSCNLADAITAANSDEATGDCPAGSGADTITLMGDVTLTAALPVIESDITIEGNGYTISGNERHQIFWVEESGALAIQNATLADGRGADDDDLFDNDLLIGGAIVTLGNLHIDDTVFTGNAARDKGGAIFSLDEAVVTISNTKFIGNAVENLGLGGAIHNSGEASISINASDFSYNSSGRVGGAIFNSGEASININASSFSYNSSVYFGGGAIYNTDKASISINASNFRYNTADSSGGAIDNSGGAINISDSVFTGNSAEFVGGAIENGSFASVSVSHSLFKDNSAGEDGGAIANTGKASISRSMFEDNSTVEDGGAITSNRGEVSLNSSIFIGNSAGDEGGAIRSKEDSEVNVSHSVFRDNSAEDGGAIYSWGELSVSHSTFTGNSASEEGGAIANHGTASVNSSILADNPGGDCHLGRNGELLESGNNHISDGTCGATWSGSVADGYCPPGQDQDGACKIGAPSSAGVSG